MANDFRSARYWAAELLTPALGPGSRAIDATLGNGHDTLWLCGLVGREGRVYGFDVQPEAVARTRARLEEAGVAERAELVCDGHQNMEKYVTEPVDAVMFNLGWLPGAAHGVTTLAETTIPAAEAALRLLKPDGLLTICVYPGHEEGDREKAALLKWAAALDAVRYDAMLRQYLNQPNCPPLLIAVRRKRRKGE